MLFMNVALSSPSLAERIEWLIEGLCKVIGAQAYRRGVEAALAWAVWNRVRTLGERLIALAERVRSGRLRAPGKRRDTSPRPSPQSGEGANGAGGAKRRRRTPREVAEDAIARSERTGKPIDPRKIGAVAFGYVLHWPRDGNCPPPEVGYGGRWRRPPKDYKPPKDWE